MASARTPHGGIVGRDALAAMLGALRTRTVSTWRPVDLGAMVARALARGAPASANDNGTQGAS